MTTVSASVRVMPWPPARVDSKKMNVSSPPANLCSHFRCMEGSHSYGGRREKFRVFLQGRYPQSMKPPALQDAPLVKRSMAC